MREKYDFSKGQRGKFHHRDANMNLPVYLDAEVLEYFTRKARLRGVDVDVLINETLINIITCAATEQAIGLNVQQQKGEGS